MPQKTPKFASVLQLAREALREARDDAEAAAVRRSAMEQSLRMDWSTVPFLTAGCKEDVGQEVQGHHFHQHPQHPHPQHPQDPHPQHGETTDFHVAKHHLEHRWIEKTAFGAAERVVERMSERVGERLAERVGERVGERMVEGLCLSCDWP